ncbi:MAG: hypothetical protein GY679_03240 [Mycoplasma sp.]|nr:hypothetical protein [Mycoplasma sp.]
MNKISKKIWAYATNFLIEAINFNIALVFSIIALVYRKQGLGIWAIIAISISSTWALQVIIKHTIWYKMEKIERALYLAIRKHGKKIIEITSSEIKSSGQSDIHEVLTDTDNGLEVQMIINGTGTFINVFIGVKWFIHARNFNKNNSEFKYIKE